MIWCAQWAEQAKVPAIRRIVGKRSGGMRGSSKSQVSRLCEEIDEPVHAFLDRPIEGDRPYLWIDATCVKVRQAGRPRQSHDLPDHGRVARSRSP
jgi:hypothetical protein